VEDVDANRQLMESLLRVLGQPVGATTQTANGFEVRSAINGQEAVEIWETWRPHLIWMDIWMPVMDGSEATRQIKSRPEGKSTIIIALTAAAFEEDRLEALSAGFDGFVRKPFREKTIVSILAENLGLHFVYEEPARQTASKTLPTQAEGPDENLPSLPAAWRQEMQQALTQGEVKWLRQLVEQIRPQAPALSKRMAELIENFELDELGQIIQSLPAGDV
jgi:CheY-like chemotaxis protein